MKAWIDFEKDDYDKLDIGGVDGQDWGPDVKWVIIYHFPYVNLLNEDTLLSGLVVGLATTTISNTITGCPYIQGMELTYHPKFNILWSALFQRAFELKPERPNNRDTLPITEDIVTSLIM